MIPPHTIITNEPLYINLKQAMNLTGLRRDQLKNLINNGDVLGSRVGYKTYLINWQSLIEYIENKQVKPNKRVAPND